MLNNQVLEAIEVVDQLQKWIEDRDGLSEVPVASFTYTNCVWSISVGDVQVWDDQDHQDSETGLTLEWCKQQWLEYVESLRPFMTPLAAATN
jgi:hypothetical protein